MKADIAIFIPTLTGGGAERVAINLAHYFVGLGFQTELVLMTATGALLNSLDSSVKVVDLRCPRLWTSLPSLIKYLWKSKPRLLLCSMPLANGFGLWARKLSFSKTKVIISVHNTVSLLTNKPEVRSYQALALFLKVSYRWADAIVAVSSGVATSILTHHPKLNEEKVRVIHNPVDIDEISRKAKLPVTHKWLRAKSGPVVVAAGRLTKQKDYPTLLKAFVMVRQALDAKLLIFGEGEKKAELDALIRSLGLTDSVELAGFEENVFSYMYQADVFVLSSIHEGFGNVLIEALACGTQVVSTDCPSGPSDILENGLYGKLVPIQNPEALAVAILNILESKCDGNSMKERATKFSLAKIGDQYLQLFASCGLNLTATRSSACMEGPLNCPKAPPKPI